MAPYFWSLCRTSLMDEGVWTLAELLPEWLWRQSLWWRARSSALLMEHEMSRWKHTLLLFSQLWQWEKDVSSHGVWQGLWRWWVTSVSLTPPATSLSSSSSQLSPTLHTLLTRPVWLYVGPVERQQTAMSHIKESYNNNSACLLTGRNLLAHSGGRATMNTWVLAQVRITVTVSLCTHLTLFLLP